MRPLINSIMLASCLGTAWTVGAIVRRPENPCFVDPR